MRNIVLARIDDRLIHGQIVTAWCRTTSVTTILIADNALVNDSFTQRLLKAAAPPDITVTILSVEEAGDFLKEEGEPNERIMLLTKTPDAMEKLANDGVHFQKIVLGGMGLKPGRNRFNKNVSASPDEVACMKRIVDRGIDMQYQLVPREIPINIRNLFKES
ncbi:PTS sugar transporter subunit IIB [Chloroflexota bacterium]|nr:PTS sugar transporter subunit IIB [Chloroflexota bacterium]